MRLAKLMASAGVASRRACERMIREGRVTVAGQTVTDPAFGVDLTQAVAVDGVALPAAAPELVVYALNKPPGVVSTAHDPQGRPTVVAMVQCAQRLYPVGRLDADTTGLILLTNDGELAHLLTHPRFGVEKTYRARVAGGPVRERALRALRTGVVLDDGVTEPALVRRIAPDRLEITIHEGRKRQVRRMCERVGHRVIELERVSIGPLALADLPRGVSRRLSDAEVACLRAAAGRPGALRRADAGSGSRRAASRAEP